jgi:hypothetical protein
MRPLSLHNGIPRSGSCRTRDDGDSVRKLRRLRLLPETPAPMRNAQFGYVLGVEWDVGMTAHRCDHRAMRDRDIFKDATILQDHRDDVQVVRGLGLIEKKLS